MNFLKIIAEALAKYGLWPVIMIIYQTQGRAAVKRFLTPPKAWVEGLCKANGTDAKKALKERDEAAEEMLQFLESMVDKEWVDPDPDPDEK